MNRIRIPLLREISEWKPVSERPFMFFLSFVFLFIYVWTVAGVPRIRETLLLIPFTALFLVHLSLHWLILWWVKRKWNLWAYLALQTAIAFILSSMAAAIGPLIGLYLSLIGVSAGMLRGIWRIALAVFFVLAVALLNYFLFTGGTGMIWLVLVAGPMTVFVILYVVLYSRQADAREKAQELLADLEAANRRLTEYADRIEDLTLANERQRMARELHDTLAQGLAGLILQLEAADSHLSQGHSEKAQSITQQAMTRARATLSESRRAIDGLRKELPGGLEEAVRAEVDHFISAAGISCVLDYSLRGPLPEGIPELVIRIVSESLTNIVRHAHARSASIVLHGDEDSLSVTVSDDGVGFDDGRSEGREGHYGLIGLRERVRLFGGELEIRSTPGKGTTLTATIPLPGTVRKSLNP
jgi:NarL family two-component system sensor histidine kinase YdfH